MQLTDHRNGMLTNHGYRMLTDYRHGMLTERILVSGLYAALALSLCTDTGSCT